MADDTSLIVNSLLEQSTYILRILSVTDKSFVLRANINKAIEAVLFVETYEKITQSRFKLGNQRKGTNRKEWVCQQRVSTAESEDKCRAKISIAVKRMSNSRIAKDEFLRHIPPLPAVIKIIPHHNHLIKEASSPRIFRIPSEVRNMYYGYFQKGITGVKAKRLHEEYLIKSNFAASDGTRINPRVNAIYTLYRKWKKSQRSQATKVSSDSGTKCLVKEKTSNNSRKTSSSHENSENENPSLAAYNTRQRTSQQYESAPNSVENLEFYNLPPEVCSFKKLDRKRASDSHETFENKIPFIKIEETDEETDFIKIEETDEEVDFMKVEETDKEADFVKIEDTDEEAESIKNEEHDSMKTQEMDEGDDSPLPKIVSCCSLAAKKDKNVMIPNRGNNMPVKTANNIMTGNRGNNMPPKTENIIMTRSRRNSVNNTNLNRGLNGNIIMPSNKRNDTMPSNRNNNTMPSNKRNDMMPLTRRNNTMPSNAGIVILPLNTESNMIPPNTGSNAMPLNTGNIPPSTGNNIPLNTVNNVIPIPSIPILTNSTVGINNQPIQYLTSQVINTSPMNPSIPVQRVVPINNPHIILYNPSSNTYTVVQLCPSTSPIVNSSNLYSTYFPNRIQLPTRVGAHKL